MVSGEEMSQQNLFKRIAQGVGVALSGVAGIAILSQVTNIGDLINHQKDQALSSQERQELVSQGLSDLKQHKSSDVLQKLVSAYQPNRADELMSNRLQAWNDAPRQDTPAAISGLRAVSNNQTFYLVDACGVSDYALMNITVPNKAGKDTQFSLEAGDCKGVDAAFNTLKDRLEERGAPNPERTASQIYLKSLFSSMKQSKLAPIAGVADWKGQDITVERLQTVADALTDKNHEAGADKSIIFTPASVINLNSSYINEENHNRGWNNYMPNGLGNQVLAGLPEMVTEQQLKLRDNQIVAPVVMEAIADSKNKFMANFQPALDKHDIDYSMIFVDAVRNMPFAARSEALETLKSVEEDRTPTAKESRRAISTRPITPIIPPGDTPPGGFVPPGGEIPPGGRVPPGGEIPPNDHIPPGGVIPPGKIVPPSVTIPPLWNTPPDNTIPPLTILPPDILVPPTDTVPPTIVIIPPTDKPDVPSIVIPPIIPPVVPPVIPPVTPPVVPPVVPPVEPPVTPPVEPPKSVPEPSSIGGLLVAGGLGALAKWRQGRNKGGPKPPKPGA